MSSGNFSNYAKDAPIAAARVRRPGRNFEIKAKDFTGSEQGVPIRLMAGTAKVAGVYITPVFDFKMVETEAEGGGK